MPHQVPVVDLNGKQIGEETMDFYTFSPESANYAVHQTITIWQYQQKQFTAFVPRRSDVKKGRKPWKQKGSGRSRQGSWYSPIFGKSATNQKPHGLDDKAKKKIDRQIHYKAISTVLQSKWRNIQLVDGLEDWPEARQKKLENCIRSWCPDIELGWKSMLMISRNGYGEMHPTQVVPTEESYDSPLYMSGRLIDRLCMRRPRDIDPVADGLFQCLKGRRLFISREAFFDLNAKYNKESGWAFKSQRKIEVEMLQQLSKEYPYDRAGEIAAAREVPRSQDEREFWAKNLRQEEAVEEAA